MHLLNTFTEEMEEDEIIKLTADAVETRKLEKVLFINLLLIGKK